MQDPFVVEFREFTYRKVRKECEGKSTQWVAQAINEVLAMITKQINATDRMPEDEQIDRLEAGLKALKDELISRGISYE